MVGRTVLSSASPSEKAPAARADGKIVRPTTRMQPKLAEYLSIGVDWIWLIDPIEKSAICYSQRNPAGALTETLRTENPTIEIPLAQALDINS